MKNLIFCIQNDLIEEILKKNRIIDSDSVVIRNKEDLRLDSLNKIDPEIFFDPPKNVLLKNI